MNMLDLPPAHSYPTAYIDVVFVMLTCWFTTTFICINGELDGKFIPSASSTHRYLDNRLVFASVWSPTMTSNNNSRLCVYGYYVTVQQYI